MPNPFPRLLILGHRGAPQEATENTLESFSLAVSQGADGVELDVRPAADGTPVVIHDDALDRTFSTQGKVAGLAWPALQRLTGARLPSLQQAAAWAASADAWPAWLRPTVLQADRAMAQSRVQANANAGRCMRDLPG